MSMNWFGELIGCGFLGLIGFGVFFGLLFWAVKLSTKMWRTLAARYAHDKQATVLAYKVPEAIVITRIGKNSHRFGWRQDYSIYSWTRIAVLKEGLLISAIPPVNIFCKDIYLPFDAMHIGPHPWRLWKEPYAISMDEASDLVIIIGRDTLQWLRQNTGEAPFHP